MIIDQNDIESLALCAWKEARGESPMGCEAVMHVIINRVGFPGFAHTLHDVIYGKNQFTSMSVPSDPEFNLAPQSDDLIYAHCLSTASAIGSLSDITKGAHFYANLKNITPGGWFAKNIIDQPTVHPVTARVNNHTFFL